MTFALKDEFWRIDMGMEKELILQKEVIDFIEFLAAKYQKDKAISHKKDKKRKSNFGSAKGLIIMKDNFDEPLEEFNEYM